MVPGLRQAKTLALCRCGPWVSCRWARSARPTTKTILERICFRGVTLLEVQEPGKIKRYLSELPAILVQVLRYLQLSPQIYEQLLM